MRIDRARELSSRIRQGCPEARVLVAYDGETAAVFASVAGQTARIERLSDWRENFRRESATDAWEAIGTAIQAMRPTALMLV
jgi:hypothetical protein